MKAPSRESYATKTDIDKKLLLLPSFHYSSPQAQNSWAVELWTPAISSHQSSSSYALHHITARSSHGGAVPNRKRPDRARLYMRLPNLAPLNNGWHDLIHLPFLPSPTTSPPVNLHVRPCRKFLFSFFSEPFGIRYYYFIQLCSEPELYLISFSEFVDKKVKHLKLNQGG